MNEQPKFIKDFSKKESSEERDQLAKEIREKRTDYFKEEESIREKEYKKSEAVSQLEALRDKIRSYNDASFFTKIKDFFAIKKIESEFQAQLDKQALIEEDLSKSIAGRADLKETQTMVVDFYLQEKKKWQESPYFEKDMEKFFSEEHLAALSMEEYIKLMQQFPGEMVTHVTRQGVRDHVAMFEHTKGWGEMHEGFKKICESKRLMSPLSAALSEAESYHDICEFINGDEVLTDRDVINDFKKQSTSPRQLVARLRRITGGGMANSKDFNDVSAIHVAVEEVLDGIYGGERGNEIFIVFPSAHVASHYNFFNKGYGAFSRGESGVHNDMYIWAENEKKGMAVDASIVFIPENVPVDVDSGSQFELDSSGKPIEIEQEEKEKVTNTRAYKKSNNTISSKEYWESFFSKNQYSRPSKIFYYDAKMTPTEALLDWKAKNNIKNGDLKLPPNFGKEIVDNFNRPGADKELLHFHHLALTALNAEYSPATILHCYNDKAFTGTKKDLEDAHMKMWLAM